MQIEQPAELASLPAINVRAQRIQRVLHVINGEHYSGAERVQDLLASALPAFGFEVGFACLKPNRFPDARRDKTAPLHDVGMRSRWDGSSARRLEQIVAQQKYQILHAHTPRSLMVASRVARRLKLPLVYHVHSPVGRDSTRGIRNRINQWIETRCLQSVDRMICVSHSIARYMQSLGHPARKIVVVPNGVPTSSAVHPPVGPRSEWTIGIVALFRPRKGIEVLLDAMAILKRRDLPVRLLAVGPFENSDYEQGIIDRARRLRIADRIRWTGFCRDVDAQLMKMDAFVLPSLFGEGLPMVVLEAMAIGLPTIASRVEGIPEAIRAGVDGLIFEPGNPEDLAGQIESLVSGGFDWNAMSDHARRRQAEYFSDQSMARGVAEVYRRLGRGG
jgi:glycosyltransferase involved in cell wall biosynthesis